MKKIMAATMILGMAAAGVQTAKAGDQEWAVVGKVLTGVAAAAIITQAVTAEPAPVYYSATYSPPGCVTTYSYGYCPPPPPPAPRVVYVQPAPPPPVVICPPPVYVAPAPVCVRPAPVVSFHVKVGNHHRRAHHGRW